MIVFVCIAFDYAGDFHCLKSHRFEIENFKSNTQHRTPNYNAIKQIQTRIQICELRNTANPEFKLYTGNWIYNCNGNNKTSHIYNYNWYFSRSLSDFIYIII